MGEVPTRKHQNGGTVLPIVNLLTDSELESPEFRKPGFLFEFPNNHMSISLSFGDIRV